MLLSPLPNIAAPFVCATACCPVSVHIRHCGVLPPPAPPAQAVPEFALWPTKQPSTKDYQHFIEISNSSRFTLTSSDPSAAGKAGGMVDGQGVGWWERYTIGECGFNLLQNKTAFCPNRPKLVAFSACDHLLVENGTRAVEQRGTAGRFEADIGRPGLHSLAGNWNHPPKLPETDLQMRLRPLLSSRANSQSTSRIAHRSTSYSARSATPRSATLRSTPTLSPSVVSNASCGSGSL